MGIVQLEKVRKADRSTFINLAKNIIPDLYKFEPPLEKDLKGQRGFNHPTCLNFLAPATYNVEDAAYALTRYLLFLRTCLIKSTYLRVRNALINHDPKFPVTPENLPRFIWSKASPNPTKLSIGMFKGELMTAVRHRHSLR